MQWLERTLLKKPPPRSHRLRRGLTLKSKAKKTGARAGESFFTGQQQQQLGGGEEQLYFFV